MESTFRNMPSPRGRPISIDILKKNFREKRDFPSLWKAKNILTYLNLSLHDKRDFPLL